MKGTSPILKFARYVSSGKTKSTKLFIGLMDVLVNGETAVEEGKKKTGLQYSPEPEVQSFVVNLYAQSASAYKYMAGKICLPSIHQLL